MRDARQLEDHPLDLARVHFSPRHIDKTGDAAQKVQLPIRSERAEIRGQESVFSELRRALANRALVGIATGYCRALHFDPALRPIDPVNRHQTHGGLRQRPPDRHRVAQVIGIVERNAAGFTRAIQRMDLDAELLPEVLERLEHLSALPP